MSTPPRESPKGFALLAFLLIAGLSAMAGAFLGAHLDPHEARCHALVAETMWEPIVDNETYAFLMPLDDGVVQHNETATKDHPCHESFKAKYASLTERRRLQMNQEHDQEHDREHDQEHDEGAAEGGMIGQKL